jgi:hypothetical protein
MAFNRGLDEKLTQNFRERRDTKRDLEGLNQGEQTVALLTTISQQLGWMCDAFARLEKRLDAVEQNRQG